MLEEIVEFLSAKFSIKNNEVRKNDGTRKIWQDSEIAKELFGHAFDNNLNWTKLEIVESIDAWKRKIEEDIKNKYNNSFDKSIFEDIINDIYDYEGWFFNFSKNSVVAKIEGRQNEYRTINLDYINTAIDTNIEAYRLNTGNKTLNGNQLKKFQEYVVQKKRLELLNGIVESISFDDTNFIDEYLERMHKTLNISQDIEIFKVLVSHWFWQIKRRSLERTVINQLWIQLHGQQGTGKSTVFNKIFKPVFNDLYTNTISLVDLADPNQASVLNTQLVINIEELDNGGEGNIRTDKLAAIKKIMSNDEVSYRQYYTQNTVKSRINATLISTSNEHLYEKINDETGLRRFFEFNSLNNYQERYDSDDVQWLSDNALRFIRNINEDLSTGYWVVDSEIGKKITSIQNSYVKKNSFNTFLEETYSLNNKLSFTQSLTLNEIYSAYDNFCDSNNIDKRYRVKKDNIKTKISDVYVKDFQKIHGGQTKYCLELKAEQHNSTETHMDSIVIKNKYDEMAKCDTNIVQETTKQNSLFETDDEFMKKLRGEK